MHGWTESYYECACGFIGNFRTRNSKKRCPRCSSKTGKKIYVKHLQRKYKTPIRKLKNRCEVCGKHCIGKKCRECYDYRVFQKKYWTVERRRAHSELVRKYMKVRPKPPKKPKIEQLRLGITRRIEAEFRREMEIKKKLRYLMDNGD